MNICYCKTLGNRPYVCVLVYYEVTTLANSLHVRYPYAPKTTGSLLSSYGRNSQLGAQVARPLRQSSCWCDTYSRYSIISPSLQCPAAHAFVQGLRQGTPHPSGQSIRHNRLPPFLGQPASNGQRQTRLAHGLTWHFVRRVPSPTDPYCFANPNARSFDLVSFMLAIFSCTFIASTSYLFANTLPVLHKIHRKC